MGDLTAIMIALISSGVFIEVARFMMDHLDRKGSRGKTIKILSELQGLLDSITEKTAGSRVSYIVATDGPPCMISILLDSVNPPLKSVKFEYTEFPVDREYVLSLAKLKVDKTLRLETDKLSGMLKNVYKPYDITHSELSLLDSGDNWNVFISINYVDGAENTGGEAQELYIIVSKLRNIKIKKFFKNIKFHGERLQ